MTSTLQENLTGIRVVPRVCPAGIRDRTIHQKER